MKAALVHDWLMSMGGGEKVLHAIHKIFPAPIYTLFSNKKNVSAYFSNVEIQTSFLQRFSFVQRNYRNFLPLFPYAIEQFDLSSFDLILSSSHCVAKGVITHPHQLHICYCFTPVRYAWDLYFQYLAEAKLTKGIKGIFAKSFLHYLRLWDKSSSQRVDSFVAISHYVKKRIQKVYGREADVIYPGVDTDFFSPGEQRESFYLTASRFVPYKKIDLIVEAFSHLPERQLIVIGEGPEMDKIRAKAGKNVEILGFLEDEQLRSYLRRARAFLFAAIEEFGIAPLEAMSCGTPVIALKKGSLRETLCEGISGVFFEEQTIASLLLGIDEFEKRENSFDPAAIRNQALRFSIARFQKEFKQYVELKWQKHQEQTL